MRNKILRLFRERLRMAIFAATEIALGFDEGLTFRESRTADRKSLSCPRAFGEEDEQETSIAPFDDAKVTNTRERGGGLLSRERARYGRPRARVRI